MPWSAWPCGDLWNLMPSDRRVNQQDKRDRLPTAGAMVAADDLIAELWAAAYLRPEDRILPARFESEARASLPGLSAAAVGTPDDVLAAMSLQRLLLRRDQGVPE